MSAITVKDALRHILAVTGKEKKQIAEAGGFSTMQLTRYLKGENDMRVGGLILLCGNLGIKVSDLFSHLELLEMAKLKVKK